ncbi:hypothetical protein QYM36_013894 [Artemia franciscana]|uniref:Uncharacterized protein n=1 Tax=Artemia franciscana TaxID=6661 RepID=A0AA88H9Z5_ARTSF|nr:hypothetical protein QYM36_013894 [Artemia franciscana]
MLVAVTSAKQNVLIPKFAIFSPCEVPAIGECVHATVVLKVNEFLRKLDGFMLNASRFPPAWLTSSSLLNQHLPHQSTLLYFRTPQKTFKRPNERKTFTDKVQPNPNIIAELCRSNDEWKLVVRSKKITGQIVKNVMGTESSLYISLKEPAFVAAIQ